MALEYSVNNFHNTPHYKQILDSALDAIFIIQGEKYVYTNQQGAKLLGFNDPTQLIGESMFDFTDEKYHELVKERAEARQRGEDVVHRYEICLLKKTGEKVPVEVNVSYIQFDGVPCSLSFVRENAERKKYEERLQAIHTFTAQMSTAITLDNIETITYNALDKVLGIKRGSLGLVQGRNLVHQYRWNMSPNNPFAMPLDGPGITVRAVLKKKTQHVRDVLKDPDYVNGDQVDNNTRSELAVPIRLEDRVFGVINLEKREVNGFTENEVRLVEILATYIGAALFRIDQKKDLDELNKRKNLELVEGFKRFSSMVRHDLKNPLMTIGNSIYLIKKDPEKIDQYLDLIDNSVKIQNSIMDEWGNKIYIHKITKQESDIHSIIHTLINSLNIPQNIETKILVEKYTKFSLDRTSIIRVLLNLITNGLEAMPDGGQLMVKASVDNLGLEILVSDTGTGIDEEIQKKLFTPFITSKENGTGLGLAYCKQAIEAHNGAISVVSESGEGSSFTINLPHL